MKVIAISFAVVAVALLVWKVVPVRAASVTATPAATPAANPNAKPSVPAPAANPSTQPAGPLGFTLMDINGVPTPLSQYYGKVVLLVNVASKCGFTKQYAPLEAVYKIYQDRGLVIIGVPANDFGKQEPGTNEQIKEFCTSKFDVTFPMMSKIAVTGPDKDPLYHYLTEPQTAGQFAGEIKWNFTKFLIDRSGQIIARFPSNVPPDDVSAIKAIESALAAPSTQPAN